MTGTPAPASVPPAIAHCPRCQNELPPGASGQCPRCLLEFALQPASGSLTSGAANVPSIAELQPLFPDYELQTLLGRGGMGVVYRARHGKLDRLVAIKLLLPDLVRDPAFAERFEREARALARLDHPGIVGIHDFGRAGEFYFLVMEFVDGANLRELLVQGTLSPRDVLAFVPQLCDALQFAHDHRVVHRDIKPENILVDQDGRVRIADFGLAKLLGQEPSAVGLTQTHQAVGTPHYMAPEQVGANGNVDHRADLYSLGVVLYEMLTGVLPIGRFQPPSAKSKDVRAFDPVVMKSLENDPAQRYQQAREIKSDVQAAGATAAASATESSGGASAAAPAPPTAPKRTGQPAVKREIPWRAWLGALTVFAVSFMDWMHFETSVADDDRSLAVLLRFAPGGTMTGDAWHSNMFGVPNWFVVLLAAGLATLSTLRSAGHDIPRGSTIVATSLGVVFCGLELVTSAAAEQLSPAIGLILTFLIFLVWSSLELRRVGEASLRQHRARHGARG